MNATLLALCALLTVPQDKGGDVAGRVNHEVITWEEVYKRLPPKKDVNFGWPALVDKELKQMIEERLFVQESKKLGIKIEERDIDEKLQEEIDRAGGREKFMAFLSIKKMTLKRYREHLRNQMLVLNVIQMKYREWISPDPRMDKPDSVKPAINEIVTPKEILDYYVANPTRFIARESAEVGIIVLIFHNDEERAQKLKLAASLRRKLAEGSDFMAIAQIYTDGPRRPEALMVEMKRDTVYGQKVSALIFDSMKKGEVSEPIEVKKGEVSEPIEVKKGRFYIFYLKDLFRRKQKTLGEATSEIRNAIIYERRIENRRRLLDALIANSYVEPARLFNGGKEKEPVDSGGR